MKKTIILLGFIAILASCNNSRIAELEAENIELKATVERLTQEIEVSQAKEKEAEAVALAAQLIAEEQAIRAQEATEKAERQLD